MTASVAMIIASAVLIWFGLRSGRAPSSQPAAVGKTVSIEGAAAQGSASARVAVIEYSDFECPFCGTFAREVHSGLVERYVRTGKVLLVFRQRPLPIHANALIASVAAECAQTQGRFWELHDRMFLNQKSLAQPSLLKMGDEIGLRHDAFAECMAGPMDGQVRKMVRDAEALGITSTPAFLFGKLEGQKVRVLRVVTGFKPLEDFAQTIDAVLADAR